MRKDSKKFKDWLVKRLSDLRPERKREVVNNLIVLFIEALDDIGIKIKVIVEVNEDFPKEMEDFIDMMKTRVSSEYIGLNASVEADFDEDIKEIGDKVVVIERTSSAYMHDFNTKEQLSKNYQHTEECFTELEAIVVETNLDFEFNCGHCDDIHSSDLVIYYPSLEKRYHVDSRIVKLV